MATLGGQEKRKSKLKVSMTSFPTPTVECKNERRKRISTGIAARLSTMEEAILPKSKKC